jgi:hypothetical protein
LSDLVNLLRKYARKIQKEETEESDASKLNQEEREQASRGSPNPNEKDHHDVDATTFNKEILETEDAALIYFTTLAANTDIQKEYKEF